MLTLPPLSLYIHTPWCVRKCPYCDFNSHEAGQGIPERDYLRSLERDLQQDEHLVQGRKVSSVFIGGGTPSLMSSSFIADILSEANRLIGFAAGVEITLEANPGTFEQEKFQAFHRAGVNRLSLGIQSFHNKQLKVLGRIHDRANAFTAAVCTRQAGFENFNLDLMHGLPDQTVEDALADLETAIALQPTHISWYQLTIEPNTRFHKHPPKLPDEDCLHLIQEKGHELLESSGYRQYEVSAYAKDRHFSKHNLNYWQFGDYVGVGAGAHGKITFPEKGEIIRTSKTRNPADYLARKTDFYASSSRIEKSELPLEFFMNTLRLLEGVPKSIFSERTGLDWSEVDPTWMSLFRQGLVKSPDHSLSTTAQGSRFLNSVLQYF